MEDPVNEFIKGEISAAEVILLSLGNDKNSWNELNSLIFLIFNRALQQEKKQYEKAKTAFEAADSKLRQLKGREDAKAFDIEKERNVLQERYIGTVTSVKL